MKTAINILNITDMAVATDSGWINAPYDATAFDDVTIAVAWSDADGTLDGTLTAYIGIGDQSDVLDTYNISSASGQLIISSKLLANKYKLIYTPNGITDGEMSAEMIYSLKA